MFVFASSDPKTCSYTLYPKASTDPNLWQQRWFLKIIKTLTAFAALAISPHWTVAPPRTNAGSSILTGRVTDGWNSFESRSRNCDLSDNVNLCPFVSPNPTSGCVRRYDNRWTRVKEMKLISLFTSIPSKKYLSKTHTNTHKIQSQFEGVCLKLICQYRHVSGQFLCVQVKRG